MKFFGRNRVLRRPAKHELAPFSHLAACAIAMTLVARSVLANAPSYVLTPVDLPLTSGAISSIQDINNSGQLAVTVYNSADYGTTSLRLDPDGSVHPSGPPGAYAYRLTDDGRVLSYFEQPNGRLGFSLGRDGNYIVAPYPAGVPTDTSLDIEDVSNSGTLVGSAAGMMTIWSGPQLTPQIIAQIDGQRTIARGISPASQYIVGFTGENDDGPDSAGVTRPFVYHDDHFVTLDIPGCVFAEATAVNDSGLVAGFAKTSITAGYRPFQWQPETGAVTWLSADVSLMTVPKAINASGSIVGKGNSLWFDGQDYNLATLAGYPPPFSDWAISDTNAINDSNTIVVEAINSTTGLVWSLLTPIPAPTPPTTLLSLAPLLSLRRPNRRRNI